MFTFLFKPLPLFKESLLFILANSLDVFLTFFLISLGTFEEANILARTILENFGFNGLIVFKYSVVFFVLCVIQLLANYSFETARLIIKTGIVVISLVDLWSCSLFVWYLSTLWRYSYA